jgi:hypothetical protein
MWTVTAPSPFQPSTIAPQSTLSRSPSASRRPLGRPCTTVSFGDRQSTPSYARGAQVGR